MAPVGSCGQDVARLERRNLRTDRNVDLLGEEERQVARERGLHAVRPLVEEDAVAAADHRAAIVERQGEACSGCQPNLARTQQPAIPSRLSE